MDSRVEWQVNQATCIPSGRTECIPVYLGAMGQAIQFHMQFALQILRCIELIFIINNYHL